MQSTVNWLIFGFLDDESEVSWEGFEPPIWCWWDIPYCEWMWMPSKMWYPRRIFKLQIKLEQIFVTQWMTTNVCFYSHRVNYESTLAINSTKLMYSSSIYKLPRPHLMSLWYNQIIESNLYVCLHSCLFLTFDFNWACSHLIATTVHIFMYV